MIGIITDVKRSLLNVFEGGGGIHEREILKRLVRDREVLIFPRLDGLFDIKRNEKLMREFFSLLRKYNFPEVIYDLEKLTPEEVLKGYLKEVKRVEFIHDLDYFASLRLFRLFGKGILRHPSILNGEAYYLAEKGKVKTSVELQGLGNIDVRFGIPKVVISYLVKRLTQGYNVDLLDVKSFSLYGIKTWYNAIHIKRSKYIKLIIGVSRGSLENLGLHKSKKARILYPANAFDEKLLTYRKDAKDKEDYLVFFARLTPLKGLLELPLVLKKVREKFNVKLYVMGKFFDHNLQERFESVAQREGIEYLGFVNEEKKYEIVSRAKALVYPSHDDSFSITVLESLALGTMVVAYDIRGISSVYKGLPGVVLAKEFDINGLSKGVEDVLKLDANAYNAIMNDERLLSFLRAHSSWDNVYRSLMSILSELKKNTS